MGRQHNQVSVQKVIVCFVATLFLADHHCLRSNHTTST